MSDPAEDIATALVAFLSDAARNFPLACAYSVPINPAVDLYAEHDGVRCLIIPIGEDEEKETRGTVFLVPVINLIFTAKVTSIQDRRDLSDLVHAISVAIRFQSQAGYGWQSTETLTKFDPELMRKGIYLSARSVRYQASE